MIEGILERFCTPPFADESDFDRKAMEGRLA